MAWMLKQPQQQRLAQEELELLTSHPFPLWIHLSGFGSCIGPGLSLTNLRNPSAEKNSMWPQLPWTLFSEVAWSRCKMLADAIGYPKNLGFKMLLLRVAFSPLSKTLQHCADPRMSSHSLASLFNHSPPPGLVQTWREGANTHVLTHFQMKNDRFLTEQLYLSQLTPARSQLLLSTLGFENLLVQVFQLTWFRNALFVGVRTGRMCRSLCSLPICERGANDKAWLIWMMQDQVQNRCKALCALTQHLSWGGRVKVRGLLSTNTKLLQCNTSFQWSSQMWALCFSNYCSSSIPFWQCLQLWLIYPCPSRSI